MYIKHTDKTLKKKSLSNSKHHGSTELGDSGAPRSRSGFAGEGAGGLTRATPARAQGTESLPQGEARAGAQGRGDSVSGRTCVSQRGTPSAGRSGGDEASCNSEGAVRPSFHGNLQVF